MSQLFAWGGQSTGVSASASVLPMNTQDWYSFRMDWLALLAIQGTLKSLLQHHSSKASIFRCSDFFTVQLSHPHMTTGKTIALTRRSFVGKVMSLLFNMLSRLLAGAKIIEIRVHKTEPCSVELRNLYDRYHRASHGACMSWRACMGILLNWVLESVSLSFKMFSQTWSLNCAVSQVAVMMVITACMCMSVWLWLFILFLMSLGYIHYWYNMLLNLIAI